MDSIKLPYTDSILLPVYDASRVSAFMREAKRGRWRLRHFNVTEDDYTAKLQVIYFTSEHAEEEMARCVPPGDYVSLQRRMTDAEVREYIEGEVDDEDAYDKLVAAGELDRVFPDDSRWMPVMSDTPSEILEHAHAYNHARGRVLITGLGLGCLPHGLLSGYSRITRIDIIEIDPDVRALTGKYLRDERVHIWPGSAADLSAIPEDVRKIGWDYAWHDIWSHISSRNLEDETAEHGISYGRLFDLWRPHCAEQSAWAHDMALMQKSRREEKVNAQREFVARIRTLPLDDQVEELYHHVVGSRIRLGSNVDPFPPGTRIPEEFCRTIDPTGGLRDHIRERLQAGDFWGGWADRDSENDSLTPIGNPNAHLESGNAG